MYRVSFTGYRPSKMGFNGESDPACISLKKRIAEEIEALYIAGATEFHSGMALGADTWCAEAVLQLKATHPEVRLTAMIPCRDQDATWSAEQKRRYHDIISRCDKTLYLSDRYDDKCMFKRNRALVDICDVLVAVFDGRSGGTKYTVDYAAKQGRKTIIIPPREF